MGTNVSISTLGIRVAPNATVLPPSQLGTLPQTQVSFPFFLAAGEAGVQYKTEEQMQNTNLKPLYKVTLQNFSTLWLERIQSSETKVWKLLGEGENMELTEDQLLRVGSSMQIKLVHLVTEISGSSANIQDNVKMTVKEQHEERWCNSNESGYWKCRICFEGETEEENPLVCPCRCEGSVKFTHLACLRDWFRHKVREVEHINYTEYEFAPLHCDLCKQKLDPFFIYNSQILSLVERSPIRPPYAFLQSQEEGERNVRYYRIKLHEGISVILGRSTQSGIHLKGATVSRNHLALYYTHKQLFVKDLCSKFGTFVYSPNAIYDFGVDSGVTLLVGNSLVQIGKREGFSLRATMAIPACCGSTLRMYLRVQEDKEEKFTNTTSANIHLFDFFD